MTIWRRVLVATIAAAVPATALIVVPIDGMRTNDLETALRRVVASQINDQVRERCESDPTWFLTGPLIGRPPHGVFVPASPEDLPPRPHVDPQAFELFAFDDNFLGSSSGNPRFPVELRRRLQAGESFAEAPYESPMGTGVQIAMPTGWIDSPCAYFLGRMQPPPGRMAQRVKAAAGVFLVCFVVGLLASQQTVRRVRRLAHDARESVAADYATIAPDSHRDELSSLTFVFNDAANQIHQRRARIDDQDEMLRRFVRSTEDDIGRPLAELEARLAAIRTGAGAGDAAGQVRDALRHTHDLSARIANLTMAARLKTGQPLAQAPVDLGALVERVAATHAPIASAAGVALHVVPPDRPVVVQADEALVERAVANVVNNAVRYNQPGGSVTIGLAHDATAGRFRLWVTDTGASIDDESFRTLATPKRFRGDEGWNRRPGGRGLGLTIAQEAADRSGMTLDLKRPGAGGLEVEFSGPTVATAGPESNA
jgi:signal transduction histidine kinase